VSRLREGPVVLLAWAALVAVPAAVAFLFDADVTTYLLFLDLVAGTLLIAAIDLVTRRRSYRAPEAAQAIPDTSIPAALIALGITEALLGAELGQWLIMIGAGTLALGSAGVLRELRQQREATRRAAGEGDG
jgi:hypothetical protein